MVIIHYSLRSSQHNAHPVTHILWLPPIYLSGLSLEVINRLRAASDSLNSITSSSSIAICVAVAIISAPFLLPPQSKLNDGRDCVFPVNNLPGGSSRYLTGAHKTAAALMSDHDNRTVRICIALPSQTLPALTRSPQGQEAPRQGLRLLRHHWTHRGREAQSGTHSPFPVCFHWVRMAKAQQWRSPRGA